MSNRKRKRKQKQPRPDDEARLLHDIDTDFYFIAGYTSNDVPYGITWEEAREQGLIDEQLSDEPPEFTD